MADSQRPTGKLSYRRKACYGFLVTCIFFVLFESALAVLDVRSNLADRDPFVGFEASIPLFTEHKQDGQVFLQTAGNKLAFFNAQRFPKHKADNAYRVFCLGGSTTYGRPYNDSTSFVGWIRELLPVIDSRRQWEVINAGGISYASYRLAALVDELSHYAPDLFILYTGHNEFLEERTYRELRAEPASLRYVTLLLHRTRTYALVHGLLKQEATSDAAQWMLPGEVDTILDHAVGPDAYHRDDQHRADVLRHFEFNLNRIINTARACGADVIVVSPASNLKDFSPFKSEPVAELDESSERNWFELFADAERLEKQGMSQAALDKLQLAADIDDGRADLHFLRGRLLFAQQRFPEAHQAFVQAIDQDVCPLRALPAIPASVERIAVEQSVALVDFPSIVEADCQRAYGHNSPGNEYFLDHLHPSVPTHRLLAMALLQAMIQKQIVAPNATWRDEAIALVSRRIESRIDPELQARALTNLAQVLSWAGKQEEAGPLAVAAVHLRAEQGLPEDPESLYYAAIQYAVMGDDQQATELLQRCINHAPDHAEARARLAGLLLEQQRFEEAAAELQAAIRLDPENALLRSQLDIAREQLGQN